MKAKHEPYYYYKRMLAEFSSSNKGCSVNYSASELTLRYHETDVATWYPQNGHIVLRHGGWLTTYTKERINRFLDVLDVRAQLYQHLKVWRVAEADKAPDYKGRVWCTLEGFEKEPAEFTLDTKLERP